MEEGDGAFLLATGLLSVLVTLGIAWTLGLLSPVGLPGPRFDLAPCTVRGQVLFLNGKAAANGTVRVTNAAGNLTSAALGTNGTYAASFLANASAACPPVRVTLDAPFYAPPVDVLVWNGRTAWANMTAT